MKKIFTYSFLIVFLSFSFLFSSYTQELPIGFASLNGGTTGGAGGEVVRPTNRAEFVSFVTSSQPYVIQIRDTIELILYERIDVGSNKTILGLGNNATLLYGGLEIKGDNVIVRNIRITGTYDGDWDGKTHSTDAITVYGRNVWIDHCDLSASADGLLDFRTDGGVAADYITVSWTRFSNHNKVMLFGGSESEIAARNHFRTTIHHCWFDGYPGRGVNQRMPMIRFADVHLFNNFYDDIDSYCVGARIEADVVVERNYFRNSKDPHIIGDHGLGLEDPDLVAFDNIYEFSSGARSSSGEAFDPSALYDYMPDDPALLPTMVMNGAGLFNNPGNHEPVAVNDTILRDEDSSRSVEVDVLQNDTDEDGDSLRISMIINTASGIARIIENKILYVAPAQPVSADTVWYQLVDTEGGVDTAMILVQTGTATAVDNLAERGIKVYPNPVQSEVIVEFTAQDNGRPEIRISDLSGKMYPIVPQSLPASVKGLQQYRLQTRELPNGIYLLSILDSEQVFTKKITVAR